MILSFLNVPVTHLSPVPSSGHTMPLSIVTLGTQFSHFPRLICSFATSLVVSENSWPVAAFSPDRIGWTQTG
eukprot:CAMPEP_0206424912 /NCGR_PEP_ID=MMETSP0324_2-20121206/3495_1 /ASSEMBLY_ACC=CAM_ASM_000836 /TAXON_ID=2866 /ORGANISM="Crypthecodinium cohnii, Strain Seligo" /LENGTH=71 /DNA_ID=CAMNT_0053889627 /DNA_START=205 /DNA_END=416 /DNA_ORIENTATION=+